MACGIVVAVAYGAARWHVWKKYRRNTVFEQQPQSKPEILEQRQQSKSELRAQGFSWGIVVGILASQLWHAYDASSHRDSQPDTLEQAKQRAAKLQQELNEAHGLPGK